MGEGVAVGEPGVVACGRLVGSSGRDANGIRREDHGDMRECKERNYEGGTGSMHGLGRWMIKEKKPKRKVEEDDLRWGHEANWDEGGETRRKMEVSLIPSRK